METQQQTNPEATAAPPAAPKKRSPPKKRSRKLKKGELVQAVEQWFLDTGPDALEAMRDALIAGVKLREKGSVELVARLFLGDKGPNAVNVLHQNLTINQQDAQAAGARSLESIVRKLEMKDTLRLVAAPTPIRTGADDVIDAEEV